MTDRRYAKWKSRIPVLYDWFTNHSFIWPSLSCRWGPQQSQETFKNSQHLYFSEQTDGSVPNSLIVATVEVVKPRVAAAQHISQFDEEARSPFVKKHKTILHPGEVNRIRELPQDSKILATHSDSRDVFIWDVESQPNRQSVQGAKPSRPDLILTGHQDDAEYALAMCRKEPFVLSGGKDKSVVLWSIHDHISSLAADHGARLSVSGGPTHGRVQARGIFQGHEDTVEDVQFNPSGSADHNIHMFDRRSLTSRAVGRPVHIFEGHTADVQCVQWSPAKASVFGSGSDDGVLNVWDHEKVGKGDGSSGSSSNTSGVFFRHSGHRNKVVDFHWNPADPWTIVSISSDVATTGGGTLQIWRMIDWIYRDEEEVIAELEKLKSHIKLCSSS